MNKEIIKQIFPEMVRAVEDNRCPGCDCSVEGIMFKDKLSEKEFKISGLCQGCQDSIFGKPQ